jgi:pimeloyl-ACP methyl ester carboxylesterase
MRRIDRMVTAAVLMAATHPQRIISLVLYGTFAVWPTAAPEEFSAETLERAEVRGLLEAVAQWGDVSKFAELIAPSVTMNEAQKRGFGTFARAAASPRMARALIETWVQIDIRAVLPSVSVPTLVVHV